MSVFTKKRVLVFLLVVLVGYIIYPYLVSILWGAIFAIILAPFTQRYPIKNHQLTCVIITLAMVLIILLPILTGIYFALSEVYIYIAHHNVMQEIDGFLKAHIANTTIGGIVYEKFQKIDWQAEILDKIKLADLQKNLPIALGIGNFASSVFFNLVFMSLFLYYFLYYAEAIKQFFVEKILDEFKSPESILQIVTENIRAVCSSLLITSLIAGALMTITYYCVHLPLALFFGLLTALLAMIPFTLPIFYSLLILVHVFQAKFIAAIVIAIVGFSSNIFTDNILQAKILQNKTNMKFITALLGIIAGLKTLGLIGIFLGPAILNFALRLFALTEDKESRKLKKSLKTKELHHGREN